MEKFSEEMPVVQQVIGIFCVGIIPRKGSANALFRIIRVCEINTGATWLCK